MSHIYKTHCRFKKTVYAWMIMKSNFRRVISSQLLVLSINLIYSTHFEGGFISHISVYIFDRWSLTFCWGTSNGGVSIPQKVAHLFFWTKHKNNTLKVKNPIPASLTHLMYGVDKISHGFRSGRYLGGDLFGVGPVWAPPDPVASVYCSKEMCDQQNAFTMCPLCDKACDYWNLSSACGTARASHLFDNPATVFFSIFMALWGKWLSWGSLIWVVPWNGYSDHALMAISFSLLPLAFRPCISRSILGIIGLPLLFIYVKEVNLGILSWIL